MRREASSILRNPCRRDPCLPMSTQSRRRTRHVERRLDPRLVFLYRGYERLSRCDWSMRDLYIERLIGLVNSIGNADPGYVDLPLAYHSLTVPVPQQVTYRIACTIGDRYGSAADESRLRPQGRVPAAACGLDISRRTSASILTPTLLIPCFGCMTAPDSKCLPTASVRTTAARFASGFATVPTTSSI